jgi:hypothetical protein
VDAPDKFASVWEQTNEVHYDIRIINPCYYLFKKLQSNSSFQFPKNERERERDAHTHTHIYIHTESAIFLKKINSGTHSDPTFGQRVRGVTYIDSRGNKVLEHHPGLCPEKELLEQGSVTRIPLYIQINFRNSFVCM